GDRPEQLALLARTRLDDQRDRLDLFLQAHRLILLALALDHRHPLVVLELREVLLAGLDRELAGQAIIACITGPGLDHIAGPSEIRNIFVENYLDIHMLSRLRLL